MKVSGDRSVGELVGDLTSQLSRLFRQEMLLARTEMSERLRELAKDGVLLAVGVVVALLGALALTAALILALVSLGLAAWLAAALVGFVLACVAAILAGTGLARLRASSPAPKETLASIKETAQWLKNETIGGAHAR